MYCTTHDFLFTVTNFYDVLFFDMKSINLTSSRHLQYYYNKIQDYEPKSKSLWVDLKVSLAFFMSRSILEFLLFCSRSSSLLGPQKQPILSYSKPPYLDIDHY